jgi:hypothetical protein
MMILPHHIKLLPPHSVEGLYIIIAKIRRRSGPGITPRRLTGRLARSYTRRCDP